MRAVQGNAGFTLIETLAGLAILSAVLVSTYSALSTSLALARRVTDRREALWRVEQKADALREALVDGKTTFSGRTGSYLWTVSLDGPWSTRFAGMRHITGSIKALSQDGQPFEVVLDTLVVEFHK